MLCCTRQGMKNLCHRYKGRHNGTDLLSLHRRFKTDDGASYLFLQADTSVAAVGSGMWNGFEMIDKAHSAKEKSLPDKQNVLEYKKYLELFKETIPKFSQMGEMFTKL